MRVNARREALMGVTLAAMALAASVWVLVFWLHGNGLCGAVCAVTALALYGLASVHAGEARRIMDMLARTREEQP